MKQCLTPVFCLWFAVCIWTTGHATLLDNVSSLAPLEAGGQADIHIVSVAAEAGLSRRERRKIQSVLNALGFSVGRPDGKFGRRTRRAIRRFQALRNEPQTGRLSQAQIDHLLNTDTERLSGTGVRAGETPDGPGAKDFSRLKGIDLPGNDYLDPRQDRSLKNTGVAGCRQRCKADSNCRAFTYNTRARWCFLKSGVGKQQAFRNAVSGIKQQSSGHAAANPSVPPSVPETGPDGLRSVAEIRAAAVSHGGNCDTETAVIRKLQNSFSITMARQQARVGEFVSVDWQYEPMQQQVPVFLMVAFDQPVRLKGEGFYTLLPKARAPFGLPQAAEQTRAVVPLHGLRVLKNILKVESLTAGSLNVAAHVVGYLRKCQREVASKITLPDLTIKPGVPQLAADEVLAGGRPSRQVLSPSETRILQDFGDYFRLIVAGTREKIADFKGQAPKFSPTGRFIVSRIPQSTAYGAVEFNIIDAVDGKLLSEPNANTIWFSHSDSFMMIGIHHDEGSMSVVSPVQSNRSIMLGSVGGFSIEDEKTRLVFDLENSLVSTRSSLNVTCNDNTGKCTTNYDSRADSLLANYGVYSTLFNEKEAARKVGQTETLKIAGLSREEARIKIPSSLNVVDTHDRPDWETEYGRRFVHHSPWFVEDKASIRTRVLTFGKPLRRDGRQVAFAETGKLRSTEWRGFTREKAGRQSPAFDLDGLQRFGIEVALPVKLSFSEKSRVITDQFMIKTGATTTRGNMKRSSRRLRREFGELACSLGLNFVTRNDADSNSTYFRIGDNRKYGVLRPRKKNCADKFRRRRHMLVACGEGEQLQAHFKGMKNWRLDIATNGVRAWRWEIDSQPVWLVANQCLVEPSFNSTETRFYAVSRLLPEKIVRIEKRIDPAERNDRSVYFAEGFSHSSIKGRFDASLYDDVSIVLFDRKSGDALRLDLKTGKTIVLAEKLPQPELIEFIAPLKGSAHLLQANRNGTFHVFALGAGKPSLSGQVVDGEIVVTAGDNLYDATAEGAHFVKVKFPGVTGQYSFQQFERKLRVPGLVQKVLNGEDLPSVSVGVPPALEARVEVRGGRITGEASARAFGKVAQLNLYQDGVLTNVLKPQAGGKFAIDVPRLAGTRWVSALALDDGGLASLPMGRDLGVASAPARIHVLSVGVDVYDDPRIGNLRFAKADAATIMTSVSKALGNRLEKAGAHLLADRAASREEILSSARELVANAAAGETIVFSFAGHGVKGRDGKFYLATSTTKADDIEGTALPWNELANVLAGSKARVIVFLDACHSGTAGTDFFATNDDAASGLLSNIPSGLMIFAASKGREFSEEQPRLGGGIFTTAIRDVIARNRGRHDRNGNGVIEVSELYYGVKKIVSERSKSRQTPWLARNQMIGDFAVF